MERTDEDNKGLSKSQRKRRNKKLKSSYATGGETEQSENCVKENVNSSKNIFTPSAENKLVENCVNKDQENMSSKPENIEKTREEVMAERAAKKQAKVASKNKNKPEVKEINKTNKQANVTETKENISNIENKKTQSMNVVTDKTQKLNISNSVQDCNKNDDKKESGKTKEEVMALRELKKKQKQQAKLKQNEAGDGSKTEVKLEVNKNTENSKSIVSKPETEEKSKAQLRAERRAVQEAQRAAKVQHKTTVAAPTPPAKKEGLDTKEKPPKVLQKVKKPLVTTHRVKLFAHLYSVIMDPSKQCFVSSVHPSVAHLGAQYSNRVISGSNARCYALLNTLKQVVLDFETPQDKEFTRSLEATITTSIKYLGQCRLASVSMQNSVKLLKSFINHIKETTDEKDAKLEIIEWIDTFMKEQLEKAAEAIYLKVKTKISDNDVILTYGCSSLIYRMLVEAHKENIKFRVVVVDGRPWLEGREMLRRLVKANIQCTYILVNALSFIMPEVTKVLLGAHALLSNGFVMSRVGSSQVALMAKAHNVPVLVCCETYKFCERVQTDAFVYNEIGNPDYLASAPGSSSQALNKWRSIDTLTPLNLTYDVTPPDLVSAVVTELGILPCTSVPVVLRIRPTEIIC